MEIDFDKNINEKYYYIVHDELAKAYYSCCITLWEESIQKVSVLRIFNDVLNEMDQLNEDLVMESGKTVICFNNKSNDVAEGVDRTKYL